MPSKLGASLVLAHVIDEDQPSRLITAGRSSALLILDDMTRALREQDGINAEHVVSIADVASGILDSAEQSGVDLIVVGPHRSRARDVFTGTTVERLIGLARHGGGVTVASAR